MTLRCIVLTVDQRGSSTGDDRVEDVINRLAGSKTLLRFERTAGDEFQGALDKPAVVPPVLEALMRDGSWHIGIGIGDVETPLASSTRAARGSAYLAAREAVVSAKFALWRLRVVGDDAHAARRLETALWLWAALLDRRTSRGWEVADLVDAGFRYDEIAHRLGISQSAVSQRAATAGIVEGRRARDLVGSMVAETLGGPRDGDR